MQSYKCKSCGYIYEPAEADSDIETPPGTLLETLNNEWICPSCGATNEEFEQE